jgi:predicted GNAT family acetyltransferase
MPKLPGEGHQTRHWIPASSRERAPRRSVEDGVVTMKVTDNPERSRYELHDGDTLVGFSEYHLHDGQFAFLHTQVDPDFGGHGYGGVLVRASLDDARERGITVLPYCPFVRGWIGKHPEYVELVPEAERAKFDL